MYNDIKTIYISSDYHLFHKNILKHTRSKDFNTIEEMHERIVKNHNNVVPKDGLVFNLGDLILLSDQDWKEHSTYIKKNIDENKELLKASENKYIQEATDIIKSLNGEKGLLLGNHDRSIKAQFPRIFNNMDFKSVESNNQLVIQFNRPFAIFRYYNNTNDWFTGWEPIFKYIPEVDKKSGQYENLYSGVILSHEPVETLLPPTFVNVHGHIHLGASSQLFNMCANKVNANIEMNNYYPIKIEIY